MTGDKRLYPTVAERQELEKYREQYSSGVKKVKPRRFRIKEKELREAVAKFLYEFANPHFPPWDPIGNPRCEYYWWDADRFIREVLAPRGMVKDE